VTETSLFERRETLAAQIVKDLSQRIRAGEIRPGEKLPSESQLVGRYGVSRTVVREAMSSLRTAGYVDVRHGVGAIVREPPNPARLDLADVSIEVINEALAVLELRIGVETEAAALAAQRRSVADLAALEGDLAAFKRAIADGGDGVEADTALHRHIAEATRNRHFATMFETLGGMLIPRRRLCAGTGPAAEAESGRGFLNRIHAEHESIVRAIELGDAESARNAMRIHLLGSHRRISALASG